jgi:hypothetical protein
MPMVPGPMATDRRKKSKARCQFTHRLFLLKNDPINKTSDVMTRVSIA